MIFGNYSGRGSRPVRVLVGLIDAIDWESQSRRLERLHGVLLVILGSPNYQTRKSLLRRDIHKL